MKLVCCLVVIAMIMGAEAMAAARHMSKSLASELERQGFQGELEGNITVERLGNVRAGAHTYRVMFYAWTEDNPPGDAVHSTERLLIFSNDGTYLGNYRVADHPAKIDGSAIVFRYDANIGNTIEFGTSGPPAKTVLDGEFVTFGR